MTISEYAEKEEQFKKENLGTFIDVDRQYGPQCWDMAQYYFIKYLNIPPNILGGCELVSNMLYPPKINDLLQYFDEVDVHKMIKGDIIIWDNGYIAPLGHIAIYDSCPDGVNCIFVSQNAPVDTPTDLVNILVDAGARSFRLKNVTPDPEPTPTPEPEPTPTPNIYVVKEGDTLWDICERFYGDGTRYAEVASKNGIVNPDLIYPGQVLYL